MYRALVNYSGKTKKKKKTTIEENAAAIKKDEIQRRNDENKGRSYEKSNQALKEKVTDNIMGKIKIDDLYPAPYNKEWNSFAKISPDKEFELDRSIVDVGLLSPIVAWKIKKDNIKYIYDNDNNNPYIANGDEYMILAGHSRVESYKRLYKETKDDRYLYLDTVIKEDKDIKEEINQKVKKGLEE